MTYRAGVSPELAAMMRWQTPAYPTLQCDICMFSIEVKAGRGGGPPAWLRNNKAPKGWFRVCATSEGKEVGKALHMCPRCRAEGKTNILQGQES